MSLPLVTVAFFALLVGLFALPLLPAWREIRERRDADALPIARDGRVSVAYFAERFRSVLQQRLAGPLEDARRLSTTMTGTIDDGEDFVVLPIGTPSAEINGGDHMVIGIGNVVLGDDREFLREVYAQGDLTAGDGVLLRAALVDGHATIGRRAATVRWLHVVGDLEIGRDAHLRGRVSSEARLRVAENTVFERLHAPRIEFGEPCDSSVDTPEERRELRRDEMPRRTVTEARRTVVDDDLEIPAGTRWVGDLVVHGNVRCGRGASILGAVKAREVRLEENVEIEGSVIATADVFAREGVQIEGLLLAEGHVTLGRACRVGQAPDSTSLRAATIDVAPGTIVHGSVWVDPDEGRVAS